MDSYSSTENAVIVQRRPGMPAGSLGMPLDGIKVLAASGEETPDAVFDAAGRLLNAEAAVGEPRQHHRPGRLRGLLRRRGGRGGADARRDVLVRRPGLPRRRRLGLLRRPHRRLAARGRREPGRGTCRAGPAAPSRGRRGGRVRRTGPEGRGPVAAALVLRGALDPGGLETFLAGQSDLSDKAWPRYVRVVEDLPRTATNKVLKRVLAAAGVPAPGTAWVRAERGTSYP
ncbi:hypothetical protein [Nocardioides convexus]|uniref:hypothetical protein n=1 Tax=Nocardioides convexus TaxID=2712224 RepID=UPI0024181507|nr:hypothetical protein [Nocardioides convexus]